MYKIPHLKRSFQVPMRFVEGTPDDDDLRATGSPNYVEVTADGSMELVIDAYKTDDHTSVDTYDPASGDYVLGLDTMNCFSRVYTRCSESSYTSVGVLITLGFWMLTLASGGGLNPRILAADIS